MNRLLCGLLFFSGASALIYEVAWVRMLVLAVGSTTQAASCVIGTFLGGLALGSWLAGKLSDRIKAPRMVQYGLLEIGVGILGVAVSFMMQHAPEFFAGLCRSIPEGSLALTLVRLELSCMLLLPPTVLMGATLPVVVAQLAQLQSGPAKSFSLIYALNTLGAVVGSLICAFVGFPFLGVAGTILLAAAINAAIGMVAIIAASTLKGPEGSAIAPAETAVTPNAVPQNTGLPEIPVKWLCAFSALVGFTALCYEVLWTRMIKSLITSDTYAFTAMISAFLFGLVIGSWRYNRALSKQPGFSTSLPAQLKMLAGSQYGAAIPTMVGVLILPCVPLLEALVGSTGAFNALVSEFFVAFALMVVPASFIGLTFPLVGGLAASQGKSVANAIGNVYGANTFGCIVGSLLCGLILIPTIGSQLSMQLTACATLAMAIAADWYANGKRAKWRMWVAGAMAVAFVVLMPANYLADMYCKITGSKMLSAREDAIGKVLVLQQHGMKRLMMNGTSYSSNQIQALRYMRAIALFPLLLHADPKTALVVCFGIGTTAGAVASSGEIGNVDICEISPAVLADADLFADTNYNVLYRKGVQRHLEDGRNFLLRSPRTYDAISFEPPPPTDTGVVNLYSKEFYQSCKAHLNKGGMLCQWAPMQCESAQLWKMIVKTMRDVFPYVTVWATNSLEAIVIASDSPIVIDPQHMTQTIESRPGMKECLSQVGFADPYDIAATYILGGENLDKYLQNVPSVTDNHPRLEFFLPYYGNVLHPSELEPYASDVRQLINQDGKPIPFDEQRLTTALQVMKCVRAATSAIWSDDLPAGTKLYAQALNLEPQNRYLKTILTDPTWR